MLTDNYGLPVATTSSAACAAYVQGLGKLLTQYPGAEQGFAAAIAADPGFTLAYVAKARVLQLHARIAEARAMLARAEALAPDPSSREASQIEVFRLIFAGQAEPALAKVRRHLQTWPRDALVLSTSCSQLGLIGLSGRAGRERELAALLDGLAGPYGDDWWFAAHHGMALSELGQHEAARPKIEWSYARNPKNALMAHARAHMLYEEGEPQEAIAFMASWLPDYPRQGPLHGHLSWHLALAELEVGNAEEAFRLFTDAIASDDHHGPALIKLADAVSLLWRADLAGHKPDPTRWHALRQFARTMFPNPGIAIADWHVALVEAAAGDGDALEAHVQKMQQLLRDGRYPSGPLVPALARAFGAFQRQDFAAAIDAIEPIAGQLERIGGSRAQVDLVEFTLMKSYLEAGRVDDLQRQLTARHPRPTRVPVAGVPAVH